MHDQRPHPRQAYTFAVVATTTLGDSGPSVSSHTVTPVGLAITGGKLTPLLATATLLLLAGLLLRRIGNGHRRG